MPDDLRFDDVERLFEYLRESSLMMDVEMDGPTEGRQLGICDEVNGWHRLAIAVPQDPDDGIIHGYYRAPGLQSERSHVLVSASVLSQLEAMLPDDTSAARRLSQWPIERAFVYLDVSDFSTHAMGHQALIVRQLVELASNRNRYWNGADESAARGDLEAQLCIGDGYIYVFRRAEHAALFGARMAALIETANAAQAFSVPFHFRVGLHVGSTNTFWDPGRKDWNYVGDAINEGQRVLASISKDLDDVIYCSSPVRDRMLAAPASDVVAQVLLRAMTSVGRRTDKHGGSRRVYLLNHSAIFQRSELLAVVRSD